MKIKFLILFILMLVLISCNKGNKRYNPVFNHELKFFKEEFINHIPRATNESFKYSLSKNGKYDVTGIILTDKNDKNTFHEIRDSIIKISNVSYKPTDTCLLVINMFTTKRNFTKKRKANSKELKVLEDECLSEKLPIPNFWSLDIKSETRCKLNGSYELYVLEAKKGIYWDEKYLTDGRYMPKEWKHGYSKGVAMNMDNFEIIYWFKIW